MSGLTLNARESARISVNELKPIAVPALVVKEAEPTKLVSAFDALLASNPAFVLLVSTLDLEEVGHQQMVEENVDQPVRQPAEINIDKLKALAEKTFDESANYTEAEAIELLALITKVSMERAQKGFLLMHDHELLSVTASNTYYLTNSTPF